MKRIVLFSFMNLCLIVSLFAQNSDEKQKLPKENSKVTREYDENGNLTKYDSVYTYSWSGDTTMLKSFSPKDFPKLFGDSFGFFSDSIFKGHLFFDDFDQLFAQPFNRIRDSILMKQFEHFKHFKDFQYLNDSTALNFNDLNNFFKENRENKNDSISSKSPHNLLRLQPKSMEEMMQMLQLHMKEMEEYHRKFFQKQ